MSIRASVARFTLTLLVSAVSIVQAAGIYRCTQADGSVTLSDLACPADTLTREYQGEATGSRGSKAPAHDPYSIMEQVRGIEKREEAARKAAARERKDRDKEARAARPRQASQRMLTYQEARQQALDATGYHDYETLSQAQRDRVHEEMAKYRHGPPKAEAKRATASGKRRTSRVARGDPGEGCASAGKGDGGSGSPSSCASVGRNGNNDSGNGAVVSHHR
jgi:hypothetical protein